MDHDNSPVDLPADPSDAAHPLRWTSIAIAVAAFFLLLTNATAINGWAVELAPSPLTVRLVAMTERWDETTAAIGLGTPRATLHGEWKRVQAARFAGQAAAPER